MYEDCGPYCMECAIAISAVPRMMKPRAAVLSRRKKGNATMAIKMAPVT